MGLLKSNLIRSFRQITVADFRNFFPSLLINFLYFNYLYRGARYQTGENLEAVRAEFSTLSWAVLFQSNMTARHAYSTFKS